MGIQRVLIIGCGLIGASMGLAVRERQIGVTVDGVDASPRHRQDALATGAFRTVYAGLAEATEGYDLVVLAVPVDTACDLLSAGVSCGRIIMDVCSVKVPICQQAEKLGLQERYAPTHPMAGNSGRGPRAATPQLFAGQPWILIQGFPACTEIEPFLQQLGAKTVWVGNPHQHDRAMAAVSHGIHLLSVTAMLASDRLQHDSGWHDVDSSTRNDPVQHAIPGDGSPMEPSARSEGPDESGAVADNVWARLTGPGFRDMTRLSQSPHEFWVQTLLSNRDEVTQYLAAARDIITELEQSLLTGDATLLADILRASKSAKDGWSEIT